MGWTLCMNPFNFHGGTILLHTRAISDEFQLKCDAVLGQRYLSQGQHLCNKCYSTIRHRYELMNVNISLSENVSGIMEVVESTTLLDGNNEFLDVPASSYERSVRTITYTSQETQGSISIHDAQCAFEACLRIFNIPPMSSGLSNTQKNTEYKDKCLNILDRF